MRGRVAAIVLGVLVVAGCAMSKHRAQVRSGMLSVGLHREAFLKEWGPPAATFALPTSGTRVRVNLFGGTAQPAVYDVWAYPSRATCLVFDGVRLQSWSTGKTDCDPAKTPQD